MEVSFSARGGASRPCAHAAGTRSDLRTEPRETAFALSERNNTERATARRPGGRSSDETMRWERGKAARRGGAPLSGGQGRAGPRSERRQRNNTGTQAFLDSQGF